MRGTWVKIQECYHEVMQDDQRKSIHDDQRESIVHQILQKSTDCMRRIIAPVEGQEGHTVVRVPSLPPIPDVRLRVLGLDEAWEETA